MAAKWAIEIPFSRTITSGLRELLPGEDPFETEYIWHKMYRRNIFSGRRDIAIHATSGLDMPLWDIKGKALGQPVWPFAGRRLSREGNSCVCRLHVRRDTHAAKRRAMVEVNFYDI